MNYGTQIRRSVLFFGQLRQPPMFLFKSESALFENFAGIVSLQWTVDIVFMPLFYKRFTACFSDKSAKIPT